MVTISPEPTDKKSDPSHIRHHYFTIPGITDPAALKKAAQRSAAGGETCIVHAHEEGSSCRSGCMTYTDGAA